MLTPEEQVTPGTAQSRPGPSRDMSPYEGARPSVKRPPLSGGSLRFSWWPFCLTALEGTCLRCYWVGTCRTRRVGSFICTSRICGKHLATGNSQILGDMYFSKPAAYLTGQRKKERFDKDIITELSKIPMDVNVPVEGWARFTIPGLSLFHVFGATIKMTAVTDGDRKCWGLLQPPGK